MKKYIILFTLLNSIGIKSQTHLVNYDYSYYVDMADPGLHSFINYGTTDFHLPNRFITSYEWIWHYSAAWDTPIKNGFTHTASWVDVPDKNTVPVKYRAKQFNDPICFAGYSFWHMNDTPSVYAAKILKYQFVFKTGNTFEWISSGTGTATTYYCPPTPSSPVYPTDSNSIAAYCNIGGLIRKNVGLVTVDLEKQFNIDKNWGPTGLDTWLTCLKNNNTTTWPCNPDYTGSGGGPYRADLFMPTPLALSSPTTTFIDFKKAYFRRRLKDTDAPIYAYKNLSTNRALIGNYSTNIFLNDVFVTHPTVTWSQLTTDATKINWMFRDTVNFTSFGNFHINNLDIITPDDYHSGFGRYGDYSPGSGNWLQESLLEVELSKSWNPTKPVLPYHWLKNDPGSYRDMPDGSPNYAYWMDPLVAEASPIFAIMCGADGFILWDGDQRPNVNQHVTDYYVKGMRRLAHFNSILTPTLVSYYKNLDPIQIKNLNETAFASTSKIYDFGIARGIVKGDSILIAAMNPNAQMGQITRVPISYSNSMYTFIDTVVLTGRQVFLGAAKMNALCTIPSSPILSSTSFSACPTNPATLTAIGCAGGTIYWNTGAIGSSIIVSGAGSYNAYCSIGTCSSSATSFSISSCTSTTSACAFVVSWGSTTAQTCSGVTTYTLRALGGIAEYSIDGTTWNAPNIGTTSYSLSLPATPSCVNFWIRPITCTTPSSVVWGCYIGQGYPCLMPTFVKAFEDRNEQISIYPNPAKSELNVLGIYKEELKEVIVKDVLGRELIKQNNSLSVNIDGLSAGNYFIQIVTKENLSKTLKFIKE